MSATVIAPAVKNSSLPQPKSRPSSASFLAPTSSSAAKKNAAGPSSSIPTFNSTGRLSLSNTVNLSQTLTTPTATSVTDKTDKVRKPLSTITNANVTPSSTSTAVHKVKPTSTTTSEKVDLNKTMPINVNKATEHTTATTKSAAVNKDSMKSYSELKRSEAHLQTTVEEYQQQLSSLTEEVSHLKAAHVEKEQHEMTLTQEITQLKAQMEAMQKEKAELMNKHQENEKKWMLEREKFTTLLKDKDTKLFQLGVDPVTLEPLNLSEAQKEEAAKMQQHYNHRVVMLRERLSSRRSGLNASLEEMMKQLQQKKEDAIQSVQSSTTPTSSTDSSSSTSTADAVVPSE